MPKKTLPRNKRLIRAKQWVAEYEGEHLIRGYRKKFGVDRMSAIEDLYLVGAIDEEKRNALKQQELERQVLIRRQRQEKEAAEWAARHANQNNEFYFIAGYTSGGAPYGVTWKEMGLEPWEE